MATETSEKTQGKMIGSILKAAQVLEYLSQSPEGLNATEIARKLDQGVSGTFHMLNTMRACGMIDQNPENKKYTIGFRLYKLCSLSGQSNVLERVAQPYLDRLSAQSGETGNLIVLRGLQIIYAAQSSAHRDMQMFTRLGSTAPYYCTGAGKAMLAFLPETEWERYIKTTDFVRYTAHTIINGEELRKELEEIRRTGIAYDREEREDGVSCIAVPVFDGSGHPVAAVSVSGPAGRIREKLEQHLKEDVLETAAQLTEEMK